MAQGPSDTILVAIRITLRIRESKVRNPDPPYYSLIVSCRVRWRFVLSERIVVIIYFCHFTAYCLLFISAVTKLHDWLGKNVSECFLKC